MTDLQHQPVGHENFDLIVHAPWLITGDGNKVLYEHSLCIRDGQIQALLPARQARRMSSTQVLELKHHILMPGLVNAHGHSAMTLFRGFADDLPLQPWLEQKIWPAEQRWVNEEFVRDGARLAIAEMLLAGITCFSDMYFFPDQVAEAAEDAHIRAQLACPVLDFATAWAREPDEYIRKTTALHDSWRSSSLVSTAFGPHAPYTVSDEPLRKIAMLAAELEIPVQIHLHENAREITDSQHRFGKRPLERLAELGLLAPSLQAVHMTQLHAEEITLLAESGVHVVHCPASNMKLSSGTCPVTELLDAGVNVCLGTDSAASNNRLDLFGELRLASLLAKHTSTRADSLNAATALKLATINGARSLGLDSQIGSLVPGKSADFIAVNMHRAHSQPLYDPESAVTYSAEASQVSHVWVNGRQVVKNGELITIDREEVIAKAAHWAARISGSTT